MTDQGEKTCFFVSPTLVPKHKNVQLPSSATTFSSKTAILPQTSRIGPNAAKRNIIVIGETAGKTQGSVNVLAMGHCMGRGGLWQP
jgi:hypothetical protein